MTTAHHPETIEIDGTHFTYPAQIVLNNGQGGISMSIQSASPQSQAVIVGLDPEQALKLAASLVSRTADILQLRGTS